ncbi:hypothetical protein ACX40Y_07510 [Sphingomonas sp. RS6]
MRRTASHSKAAKPQMSAGEMMAQLATLAAVFSWIGVVVMLLWR